MVKKYTPLNIFQLAKSKLIASYQKFWLLGIKINGQPNCNIQQNENMKQKQIY